MTLLSLIWFIVCVCLSDFNKTAIGWFTGNKSYWPEGVFTRQYDQVQGCFVILFKRCRGNYSVDTKPMMMCARVTRCLLAPLWSSESARVRVRLRDLNTNTQRSGLFTGILVRNFFCTLSKQSSAQHSRWKTSTFTSGLRFVCTVASRPAHALQRPIAHPQASAVLKEIASQYPYEPGTDNGVRYLIAPTCPWYTLKPECTLYPSLVCRSQVWKPRQRALRTRWWKRCSSKVSRSLPTLATPYTSFALLTASSSFALATPYTSFALATPQSQSPHSI